MKKSKERREEPLGTMSYQKSSSRRSLLFFVPYFQALSTEKFRRYINIYICIIFFIFSRPFRLSLAPTICPWVSEDGFLINC